MKYTNKFKNKTHFIKIKNKINSSKLHFGNIGLISLNSSYLNSKEFDSCKNKILKLIKSKGKLIIKVNPFLGVTSKPIAIRMGKGKGMIDKWVIPTKKGTILFEVVCSKEHLVHIKNSLEIASNNLSISTKIITEYY